MSRIHPSDRRLHDGDGARRAPPPADQPAAVYTVWKRSSMGFLGTDGFSVYDAAGSLAFRVDNYSRRRKLFAGDLLLMDGHGAPLLSLRPQILSLHDRWNCYEATGGEGSAPQQLFTMSKCSALPQSRDEAEVYMSAASSSSSSGTWRSYRGQPSPSFRVEGCFSRRSCKIRGSDGREVARISRKSAFTASAAVSKPAAVALGDDVFSLVVRPGVDAATVMAVVVVMDRICRRPYTPLACSSQ